MEQGIWEEDLYLTLFIFFLNLYFYSIQSKIQINIHKDDQNSESRSAKINLWTCPKYKN